MVNSARAEAAQSEKLLKEANGKIDVLQAEVKALKELVVNSTAPTTPHKGGNASNHLKQPNHSHHNRQSSLNQQSMAHFLTTVPTNTSTPASNNTSTTTLSSTHLGGGGDKSITTAAASAAAGTTLKHSATSVQPLSASMNGKEQKSSNGFFQQQLSKHHHKRVPSENPSKSSFIDKLFHSSNTLNVSGGSGHRKSENKYKLSTDSLFLLVI